MWAPTYAVTLAPKTRNHYANLGDHHVAHDLGGIALRELRADRIARWQADRLAAGGGAVAMRHALDMLGSILQRAVEMYSAGNASPSSAQPAARGAAQVHSFAVLKATR